MTGTTDLRVMVIARAIATFEPSPQVTPRHIEMAIDVTEALDAMEDQTHAE